MSPETRLDPARLLAELDALIGPLPAQAPATLRRPPPAPEASPPPPPSAEPIDLKSEPSPSFEPAGRRKTARVLIVDDNADYRKVVRFLLATNGYAVTEARDGEEGLKAARDQQPDLALLDFDMPNMNGYELLQELRSRDDTRKLPVIFLTGAANRRHLKDLSLDVACFLDKPVTNSQLLETVASLLAAPAAAAQAEAPEEAPPGLPDISTIVEEPSESSTTPPPEPAPELLVDSFEDTSGDDLLIEEQKKDRDEDTAGLDVLANDSPLVNRINRILVQAVEMGASDVHIEPQERSITVRVRVDGSLRLLCRLPIALHTQVAARIKIMSNLIITERRRPQDGQVRAVIKGRKIEFRVSTIPALHGEKVVMRILGGVKLKETLEELELSPRDLDVTARALQSPHGLLLVTGPTGSGKSTTLYTMVRQLNQPDINIMTAEDPVEYELAGINQVPVRAGIGVTFEAILRSFLRQDPDVMLVGEIRDLETAEIAVKAAITGHVVLSTLHTNSAPASVMRLTHMGLAPYLVADSLKLVIAQRLVRRICPSCRAPSAPSDEAVRIIGAQYREKLAKACAGLGCAACHKTGYKGRMPLFEVMNVSTPELRELILSEASLDKLTQQAKAEGMRTLADAALDAVAEGATTIDEARDILLGE